MTYTAQIALYPAKRTEYGSIETIMSFDSPRIRVEFDTLPHLETAIVDAVTPHGYGWTTSIVLVPRDTRKPRGFDALRTRLTHRFLEAASDE